VTQDADDEKIMLSCYNADEANDTLQSKKPLLPSTRNMTKNLAKD
jgi:hypothetical protein